MDLNELRKIAGIPLNEDQTLVESFDGTKLSEDERIIGIEAFIPFAYNSENTKVEPHHTVDPKPLKIHVQNTKTGKIKVVTTGNAHLSWNYSASAGFKSLSGIVQVDVPGFEFKCDARLKKVKA